METANIPGLDKVRSTPCMQNIDTLIQQIVLGSATVVLALSLAKQNVPAVWDYLALQIKAVVAEGVRDAAIPSALSGTHAPVSATTLTPDPAALGLVPPPPVLK